MNEVNQDGERGMASVGTTLGLSEFPGHRRLRPQFFGACLWAAVAGMGAFCILFGAPTSAHAEEEAVSEEGNSRLVSLLRVRLPLTGSADQTLQATIKRVKDELLVQARDARDGQRPTLILELDPRDTADQSGAGSQFERVFALARFLVSREMAGVKTVAYAPRSLQGHSVMLALACEELIMAPDAMIGEAGVDERDEGTIRQTVVAAYREIAETQRTIPVALAVGMINPDVEVLQVEAQDGIHFVLREELDAFREGQEILEEKVLVPAGTFAEFDGREGRQFGFVKYLARDRNDLSQALNVRVRDLEEIDLLADGWLPVIIDITGEITPKLASRVQTLLGTSLESGRVNWVGLRIDSGGGDLAASVRLATTIAKIDSNSVRTVAYVPTEATGGAALVALACDQLVMHPEARLSAIRTDLLRDQDRDDDAQVQAAEKTIRHSIAPRTEHSWSLFSAMIDPDIQLNAYRNRATGLTRVFSANNLAELPHAQDWQQREALAEGNQQLSLDGPRAEELGIAWRVVANYDDLKQLYGFDVDPPNPQPNRALELIEALASPELAIILLMIGFAGIYVEIRTPGLGAGAFVGSVALMLFFWSKYLDGTAGWLEILLFMAGVCFVLMEIFVLPGFGIFGLGGGGMILASLVLASLTFVRPHSERDIEELSRSVGGVAIAAMGVLVFAMISRRFLPRAPLFRSIVLEPPPPEERHDLEHRESVADYSALMGAEGVATTDLRPVGKAKISNQYVDVIAVAEPLKSGERIEVIEVHGSRVVVQAARR